MQNWGGGGVANTQSVLWGGFEKREYIQQGVSPSVVNGNAEELKKKKKQEKKTILSHEEKKARALHVHHIF